ncbi:hypothetical protein [Sediminibacterium ginsengisoli]|uniref:Uncharacterized protein n=1 Tax=Sediminibacterium ginsengisoli TaxID=413434 RepID=A0A1T4MKT4_9BACT|nr:hypothetical protein [Sediminibacterium ginsengisoli]SJZ67553.1 hypothetical protein SAMN04488132_103431 [Sediminibacterium ginsengisoli]
MRRLLLLLSICAGSVVLNAQNVTYGYNPPKISETIFNSPKPRGYSNNFDFLLPKGNRMVFEMSAIYQLRYLPDLDSLLVQVHQKLAPLKDSLSDPLSTKRVDVVCEGKTDKIRITTHQPPADYFAYNNGELSQLKTDQDTLRITLFADSVMSYQPTGSFKKGRAYAVMFILNNIEDIATFEPGYLMKNVHELLLADMAKQLERNPKTNAYTRYYGIYDFVQHKRISPYRVENYAWARPFGWEPVIAAGMQYARGTWLASAALGIKLFKTYSYGRSEWRLLWEPYFFFSKDAANKLLTDRNDFVTLRYQFRYQREGAGSAVVAYTNMSFGYLVRRQGDWLDPNTKKLSIGGLLSGVAVLEPELLFTGFFKQVSPSLKLSVTIQ